MDYKELELLVDRAVGGDDDAFAQLYERLFQHVYYVALKNVHIHEDALDIVQETMICLHKNLKSLQNSRAVVAYVNRMTYGKCMDLLRAKHKWQLAGEVPEEEQEHQLIVEDPERNLLEKELHTHVIQSIEGLSDNLRLIVFMYYFEELNSREIADILHIQQAAVRTRLTRAREQLKAKLAVGKKPNARMYSLAFLLPMVLRKDEASFSCQEAKAQLWSSLGLGGALPIGGPIAAQAVEKAAWIGWRQASALAGAAVLGGCIFAGGMAGSRAQHEIEGFLKSALNKPVSAAIVSNSDLPLSVWIADDKPNEVEIEAQELPFSSEQPPETHPTAKPVDERELPEQDEYQVGATAHESLQVQEVEPPDVSQPDGPLPETGQADTKFNENNGDDPKENDDDGPSHTVSGSAPLLSEVVAEDKQYTVQYNSVLHLMLHGPGLGVVSGNQVKQELQSAMSISVLNQWGTGLSVPMRVVWLSGPERFDTPGGYDLALELSFSVEQRQYVTQVSLHLEIVGNTP